MTAFEEQYRAVEKNLYLVAIGYLRNTEDARDAVQEAALAAYRAYPGLREKRRFRSWITRILVNKCLDMLRQTRARDQLTERAADPLGLLAEVPVQELELMDLIGRLPVEQRACILLRFYQDLTYRETARVLGIPESTVKARTKAALGRLAEWMKEA